jgi:peroxiredoxin family protein
MADESDDTFSPDPFLDAVLLNDKPFYERLIEEAMLIRELPLALAEDPVYQMLKEVDKIVYAKDLPDEIIAAGRVDAAIRLAVDDILDDIPEKEWRINAALLGIGLSDSEREGLLASIYTDHQNEMVEYNLEKSISDQLERLKNVSHRGFYRIPECHMVYNLLLTSENPKLLAGMIRAWDMAGGFARAALKGMSLIFGLPANILDQLTDSVSDTFSRPLIRYPLAIDRSGNGGQEDGDQRTAEFPLDLFPTDPLPMPEIINEIRRGQQHRYIRIMGDESLQSLRQQMESFLNLHWGGFAFFDGGFDQLGPDIGIPNRLNISTEKGYRLIILFFHPEGDLIKQALNGSEIAERSVGSITYVRETGATP